MADTKQVEMRPYRLEDIPQITAAVKKYLPDLPHYKNITVAEDRLAYLLTHNFGRDAYFACWVLVDGNKVVGGMAAYCTNGMVTWDLIANDVFLFVFPEYRTLKRANELVRAYKDWAMARGAVLITASVQSGYEPEQFDIFVKRLGFIQSGTLYHLRMDSEYIETRLKELGR